MCIRIGMSIGTCIGLEYGLVLFLFVLVLLFLGKLVLVLVLIWIQILVYFGTSTGTTGLEY